MKIDEITVGMKVTDKWFPNWGTGKVITVLKTVVYVDFQSRGKVKYDKSHLQFLYQGVFAQ